MTFSVRRSSTDDIAVIRSQLIGDDEFILQKRFRNAGPGGSSTDPATIINLSTLIETQYLCITVLQATSEDSDGSDDAIVGFAAFSDAPSTEATLIRNAHRWEHVVDQCVSESCAAGVHKLVACETIWLNFFTSSFGNGVDGARTGAFELESEAFAQIIKTVFSTCPKVQRVAYALPAEAPVFSPLAEYLSPIPEPENNNKPRDFTGSIHTVRRDEHQEPLVLRPGVVEDYDDFVPMLLDGAGVVTPLPSALYLEELLQDDNPYTAVIVAEDPETHAAIGLMCIDASYEGQQHVTKQYATEPFNKLKALAVPQAPQFKLDVIAQASDVVSDADPVVNSKEVKRERHAPKVAPYVPKKGGKSSNITQGQHANHNSFHITLFYLYPEYESRAHQFIAYAFSLFKFAEYAYIMLPHAAPEHPLLHHFSYVPIKRFQPTNAQGERLPLPEGLWLCCRYGMEQVQTHRYVPGDDENVGKLLKVQSELQASTVEAITVALAQIGHETNSGEPHNSNNNENGTTQSASSNVGGGVMKPLIGSNASISPSGTYAVTLTWRKQPVGILVTRAVSVEELYALRRNFDLEKFVNMYPHGDKDYGSTNIYLEEDTAKTTHYRNDMPAHVVKFAFVKPVFRHWLRFLMREAMRLLPGCELLLHVTQPQADIYNPLVNELIFAPPRRIVEKSLTAAGDNNNNNENNNNSISDKNEAGNQDVDGLICLFHTTRKALSDEKTKIHSRIVVSGASATGLAFIYNLMTIPYLHFTNILLLSPDGLPAHPNHCENMWFADTMDWTEREYLLIQLPGRFRIAESHLVDFDRFDKYIYTVGGTCEPYDQLILTTGRQYSIPRELSVLHGAKNGVFPLSGTLNMAKVQQHVHESEIFEDALSSAVIYGHSLDIYCIAATIMRLGLSPHRTVVVLPEDTAVTGSLFMDPTVDLKLDRLLSGLGVKLLRGYTLDRMEYDEDNNLSMVVVAPMSGSGGAGGADGSGKVVEISASLFLYAHDKDIDSNVLSSLNKRSIVFDGRVIVENNYRTTDPNIYAAGPVAMFSLRFGPSRDFEEFAISEIGKHLAHTVLGFLGVDEFYDAVLHDGQGKENAPKDDPLGAELGSSKTARGADGSLIQRERPKPLPRYVEPVTKRVLLPGAYIYCITHSVAFPAYAAAEEHYNVMTSQAGAAAAHSDNSQSVAPPVCTHLTSSDDQGNTYVRVSVNKSTKIIEAVIYFGDDPTVELSNLRSLVGLPSSVLNLMYNYDQHAAHHKGAKLDILNFLRQPWAYVLFYDKFREMFENVRGKFKDGVADSSYVVERVRQDILEQELLPHNADALSDEQTRLDYHNQLASETGEVRREFELELIRFLHEHKCFLPQRYFLPDISSHVAQPQ